MKNCCCSCPTILPPKEEKPEDNSSPISYKFINENDEGELDLYGELEYDELGKNIVLKTGNGVMWDSKTNTLSLLKSHED